MQNIIIDKPYRFVKPASGTFWLKLFEFFIPRYLRKNQGIVSWEIIGRERLQQSIDAGHGIMLAPNHCRPSDPMLLGMLCKEMGKPSYIMASWHLFMQGKLLSKLLPKLGVFSIYREGIDRDSIKFAIQALAEAKRMLILFPEGIITRTNNRLNPLMEGTSFIARSAAKKRCASGKPGKTVVHPIGIRYFFDGDLESTLSPVLDRIEKRLSWRISHDDEVRERINKIGLALLNLKEMEYFGKTQTGFIENRLEKLIYRILSPLEEEWMSNGLRNKAKDVSGRVKNLRMAILPDMVAGEITEVERKRRWGQLTDTYLAQQLYLYPPGYLGDDPAPEQILETVERFEEDLTDEVTVHFPLRAVIEIGDAIEVNPERDKMLTDDPLMEEIHQSIESILEKNRRRR